MTSLDWHSLPPELHQQILQTCLDDLFGTISSDGSNNQNTSFECHSFRTNLISLISINKSFTEAILPLLIHQKKWLELAKACLILQEITTLLHLLLENTELILLRLQNFPHIQDEVWEAQQQACRVAKWGADMTGLNSESMKRALTAVKDVLSKAGYHSEVGVFSLSVVDAGLLTMGT